MTTKDVWLSSLAEKMTFPELGEGTHVPLLSLIEDYCISDGIHHFAIPMAFLCSGCLD